jgi:adenosine deaminase
MTDFARKIPKAELHLHIEGTLEPEMMFELARRNGLSLPYGSVDEAKAAYVFENLQSFLDLYYRGCAVLRTEQDFHDLTWAYLQRAAAQGVRHAEIFFDPQSHTARGVRIEPVVAGIRRALEEGQTKLGISSGVILCFLRHLPQAEAMATLEEALPLRAGLLGIGLDSSEVDHPPSQFRTVFERGRAEGLHAVAHAGEEGPPGYIVEALDLLGAERIDHGVRCSRDPQLMERLADSQVPLTVCPLSNVRLRVFPTLEKHNLKLLLDHGLLVTVNSDDPAYFGGYVGDTLAATADALQLSREEIITLAKNSFLGSFLPPEDKARLLAEVDQFAGQASSMTMS